MNLVKPPALAKANKGESFKRRKQRNTNITHNIYSFHHSGEQHVVSYQTYFPIHSTLYVSCLWLAWIFWKIFWQIDEIHGRVGALINRPLIPHFTRFVFTIYITLEVDQVMPKEFRLQGAVSTCSDYVDVFSFFPQINDATSEKATEGVCMCDFVFGFFRRTACSFYHIYLSQLEGHCWRGKFLPNYTLNCKLS